MNTEFWKYQALGNDMVVIDPGRNPLALTPAVIRRICHRHFGVGADGICYGPLPDQRHPLAMRFFNPDGGEAEKSGNGLRIFARYLWDVHYVNERAFTVAIGDETIPAEILDERAERIRLGMGRLRFEAVDEEMVFGGESFRVSKVSIGNPHAVIFSEGLERIHELGPLIEGAPQFPNRTNVQLVRVLSTNAIQIEIWERGAGYTMASGTSGSAAAAVAVRTGRCRSPVKVKMAGGSALVFINEQWQVELEGSVTQVYRGSFSEGFLRQL